MLHLRRAVRLSAPLLTFALLPVSAATAATPAGHLVSVDQARNALPAANVMPGHPATVVTSTLGVFASATPCPSPKAKPLVFKGSHPVTNIYIGKLTSSKVIPPQFSITAIVFHTTATAKTAMATIVQAEAHCPKRQGDTTATLTRTASAPYSSGGWAGWRSVGQLTVAPDPTIPGDTGLSLRLNTEYLLRGNVVLVLSESASATPGSGPKQEAARKAATKTMLAGFAAL